MTDPQNEPRQPQPGSVASLALNLIPGRRSVLKCRCGALYLNPDAHLDSFGHRPEPVAA